MMRTALVFEASRDGYGIDQIADRAMTVGELKRLLEDYDDDNLIVMSHDRGYTYGSISFLEERYERSKGRWSDDDGEFDDCDEEDE